MEAKACQKTSKPITQFPFLMRPVPPRLPQWSIERRRDACLLLTPSCRRRSVEFMFAGPCGGRSMIGRADVLNSWKEIAAYLRRGVRTVQRWERELNLPVRRSRNRRRSAVIALSSDLDSWLATRVVTNENSRPSAISNGNERISFLQRRLSELEAEAGRIREELSHLEHKRAKVSRVVG